MANAMNFDAAMARFELRAATTALLPPEVLTAPDHKGSDDMSVAPPEPWHDDPLPRRGERRGRGDGRSAGRAAPRYAWIAGAASGSTGSGLPARRIRPQMTAPTAKIAVAHQNATT